MQTIFTRRRTFVDRVDRIKQSDTPLRKLAGDISRVAKLAIDEANSLSVERTVIQLPRLPKKLDGFRIVHLSDIHHSSFTGAEHIETAVEISNRLAPDMVVLTGDYVSHDAEYILPVAKMLGRLRSRAGTFACLGNHDHWTDPAFVANSLRESGVDVLINTGFRFELDEASFWLAGVDDHMVGRTDLPAALRGSYPDEMKLLLAHNPIIFRHSLRHGVDLTLSGHTHGGQVRMRDAGRRLIRRRRLTNGLHSRKESQIYVTRGIGTVVLPIRYQCPPEITLLELRSA